LDLGGASVLGLTESGDGSAASFGALSAADDVNLEWVSGGSSACYVLYTSGSTGKPKGVELEHRNVVHFVDATMRLHPCDMSTRALVVTAITFDAIADSIYPTFAVGGCLVALPKQHLLDDIDLVIKEHNINRMHDCTPSLLSLVSLDVLSQLDSALVGGEVLPVNMIEAWSACIPHFYNVYGPTETTVDVTSIQCSPDMAYPFSIGKPFHNVRGYIVDPADPSTLMPPGVPGELVVSGHQVGRGYKGLPDQTAKAFITSPFAPSPDSPHARMYRTGDLCRWLPDGTIGFMGRIDQQVKLRGLRIELGEFENVLLQHEIV
jgi:amino acid adenylation domain-containing protein